MGLRAFYVNTLTVLFTWFNDNIEKAKKIILDGTSGIAGLDGWIISLNNAILPTAWTILGLLFLIDLIQTIITKGDEARWEDIFNRLVKLLICRNAMTILPVILTCMLGTVNKIVDHPNIDLGINSQSTIIDQEFIGTPLSGDALYDDPGTGLWKLIPPDKRLPSSFKNAFKNLMNAIKNFATQTITFMGGMIVAIACNAVGILINIMAYGRAIQISILAGLSPLPMAFVAYSETKEIPKKFLFTYFSVALTGLIMLLNLSLFKTLLSANNASENLMTLLTFTAALGFTFSKSGQFAKDALGQ